MRCTCSCRGCRHQGPTLRVCHSPTRLLLQLMLLSAAGLLLMLCVACLFAAATAGGLPRSRRRMRLLVRSWRRSWAGCPKLCSCSACCCSTVGRWRRFWMMEESGRCASTWHSIPQSTHTFRPGEAGFRWPSFALAALHGAVCWLLLILPCLPATLCIAACFCCWAPPECLWAQRVWPNAVAVSS
jgi:hypothetical protein